GQRADKRPWCYFRRHDSGRASARRFLRGGAHQHRPAAGGRESSYPLPRIARGGDNDSEGRANASLRTLTSPLGGMTTDCDNRYGRDYNAAVRLQSPKTARLRMKTPVRVRSVFGFLRSIPILVLICAPVYAQWVKVPSGSIPRGPDGKPNLSAPA